MRQASNGYAPRSWRMTAGDAAPAARRPGGAAPALLALLMLAACLLAAPAGAQQVRMLVQSSPLAGYRYHEAPAVFADMRAGDTLALERDAANVHDANAVRVSWRGRLLGYVPRRENAALAWAMDQGMPVAARVSALREHANPRRRVEFEVYVE
jgi:hypothetical protein